MKRGDEGGKGISWEGKATDEEYDGNCCSKRGNRMGNGLIGPFSLQQYSSTGGDASIASRFHIEAAGGEKGQRQWERERRGWLELNNSSQIPPISPQIHFHSVSQFSQPGQRGCFASLLLRKATFSSTQIDLSTASGG